MRLYVCWGTFPVPWPRSDDSWRPDRHPCKLAHDALRDAGHAPEVVRAYGFRAFPDFTPARRTVRRLTGSSEVPILVLDDGQVVKGSQEIVAWARASAAA